MTPAEWFASTDAVALFAAAPLGPRRTRLFLAACLRRHWDSGDDVFRDAVEFAEQLADGRESESELEAVGQSLFTPDPDYALPRPVRALRSAAYAACRPAVWYTGERGQRYVRWGLTQLANYTADQVEADLPGQPLALSFRLDIEQRKHAELVRCVAPPPGPRPAFDPRWLTASVVGLAHGIYDRRAFADCPILADAFEDAGCDDAALLAHLRGGGPHGRGCWPVDLAAGRDLAG